MCSDPCGASLHGLQAVVVAPACLQLVTVWHPNTLHTIDERSRGNPQSLCLSTNTRTFAHALWRANLQLLSGKRALHSVKLATALTQGLWQFTACEGFAVLHRGAHSPRFASSCRSSDGGFGAVLASTASSAFSSFCVVPLDALLPEDVSPPCSPCINQSRTVSRSVLLHRLLTVLQHCRRSCFDHKCRS